MRSNPEVITPLSGVVGLRVLSVPRDLILGRYFGSPVYDDLVTNAYRTCQFFLKSYLPNLSYFIRYSRAFAGHLEIQKVISKALGYFRLEVGWVRGRK
jgi:hypothetical protein